MPEETTIPDAHESCDAAPIFGADELRRVARTISEIHAELALAYAYGLTFQRAVRSYIPIDELDILPCLSVGVLDILDTQLPRLDALLDHLARAALPAAFASRKNTPLRYSRRSREADASEAGLGGSAAGRAL